MNRRAIGVQIFLSTVGGMLLVAAPAIAEVRISADDGIKISGDRDDMYLRIGGRLHIDGASYDDDVTQFKNDVIARRARVTTRARLGDDWRLAVDYDFGDIDGWKNLYVRYTGLDNARVTLGNQIAPFSLEEQTSSNNITFMERSLANSLSPGFLAGLSVRTWGDNWTFTAGFFGDEIDDRQRRKGDGTSVAGRATFTPVRSGRGNLIHLGASVEYRNLSDDVVTFRTRPESFVTPIKLIDTGSIAAQDLTNVGVELAWRHNRFSAQAEYATTKVKRNSMSDLNFDAGYLQLSYFLTDHRRGYRSSSGAFTQVAKDSRNAWELAARFSYADLNDGDVTGGREENLTLGLNWYLSKNYRVMLNYIDVDADPNADGIIESPSIMQIRVEVSY